MKNLFKFQITRKTGLAFLMGLVMIGLSLLMLPFSGESGLDTFFSILFRDVLMITGLGVFFVSIYCEKGGKGAWEELGFRRDKWKTSLIADIILAILLLFIFMKEETPSSPFEIGDLYGAVYILAAGIFEMLFIYGYLRSEFCKAFGIVPSILITSTFYSFHHAGFQPEFFHLFFVGVMYATVLFITNNMLIAFPFFWGVGALWDVLVSSEAGNEIKNVESFIIGLIIILVTIIWLLMMRSRRQGQERT